MTTGRTNSIPVARQGRPSVMAPGSRALHKYTGASSITTETIAQNAALSAAAVH